MWLAVDKDNSVWLFENKPAHLSTLNKTYDIWSVMPEEPCIKASKAVMLKLLDKELTWNDEPIEIL